MNLYNYTDNEIWNSFKKCEEWAISYIYTKYAEGLYQYGYKFTSELKDIEDVLQDLFVDLIRNRKSLGDTNNINLYLMKSFKRRLIRKLLTEKKYLYNEDLLVNQSSSTSSCETTLIQEEVKEYKYKIFIKALNELTPRQKEAIYLRYSKELRYKEISDLMGISVEACRNLISKSIQVLKKYIS